MVNNTMFFFWYGKHFYTIILLVEIKLLHTICLNLLYNGEKNQTLKYPKNG